MALVYLNGEYKPLSEATIHVLDRGFIFGDGVYEVIPVFNRKVFRFQEHLNRLDNSLRSIYMDNPISREEWGLILKTLIEDTEQAEQSVYVQITRGLSVRDHDIDLAEQPTVLAMSRPLRKRDFPHGINAITHEDIRWQYCDIKATTLLATVLLRHRAKQQNANEVILIRNGIVTECAASNVFICRDNKVLTPERNSNVLPGITRDVVIELLSSNNISYSETVINAPELFNAKEIWVTSSTWEIVPVIKLDGLLIGDGEPGPVWNTVNQLYQEFKASYCN